MSAILAALVNSAIVSVLVASVVALAMRAARRRLLNAATRYVIWWAALAMTITMPAWYLPGALYAEFKYDLVRQFLESPPQTD